MAGNHKTVAGPRLILDNIRSTYNVGSIMRTADGVGGCEIVCCGITPHPEVANDTRSPVVRDSNTRAIVKTALGAEATMPISYEATTQAAIVAAKQSGHTVIALEQAPGSTSIFDFHPDPNTNYALILGDEVNGIAAELLAECDVVIEIPQRGTKESLNVSVAAGIALFTLLRRQLSLAPDSKVTHE